MGLFVSVLIINNNMKLSLLLLSLALFVWTCEAAKGGAKSVINRKRQRGPGNSYIGNHHSDDGAETGIGGAFTGGGTLGLEPGSGPCVGVCYYVKKRGIKVDKRMMNRMKKRKACIGLCFLMKLRA